ncbi:MAG: ABC transporter permease [Candidatus Aminicenantia bacterium]
MKSIYAVSKKEVRELKRDWRFLFALIFIPAILLILYGYVLNFDIKNIPFAILDLDRTKTSREILRALNNSGYFNFEKYVFKYHEGENLLSSGKIDVLIVIPSDFEKSLLRGERSYIQCLIDGSDSNRGTIVLGYLNIFVNDFFRRFIKYSYKNHEPSFKVYFNQELKTRNFLMPGLIGFILMITAVLSTSLSVVREKERKTIEQLYVTPLTSLEFSIGKIIPYIIISLTDSVIIIFFARFLFNIPIRGSLFLLFLSTCLYLSCTLMMGFLISTIAETQRVAFLLSVLTSLLPSMLLSGFIFPIENMPRIIQLFTYFVPPRYFIAILRQIILKGAGFNTFSSQIVYLSILLLLFSILVLRRMRILKIK